MTGNWNIDPLRFALWTGVVAWLLAGWTALFYALVWLADRFILHGWCS